MMDKEYHRRYYLANKDKLRERKRARQKEQYLENPERFKATQHKSYLKFREARLDKKLKDKYGIDTNRYMDMLAEQNGVCAICHRPCTCGRRLAVDHNHKQEPLGGFYAVGATGDWGCLWTPRSVWSRQRTT